jgi:RNA polymerase sigma factor (sigma-70 family)
MSVSTTVHLQRCLKGLENRDAAARTELLAFAHRRLKVLAKKMFRRFPTLYSREHSDDLFQEAMIRLWQSLEQVGPTTVAAFMGLATLQMQRALCDLARRHYGQIHCLPSGERVQRPSINTAVMDDKIPSSDITDAPDELACWSEFHTAAGRLEEPYRTAFALSFYHELPQAEIAELMNVSVRQVQRYWHTARLKLSNALDGSWPEL